MPRSKLERALFVLCAVVIVVGAVVRFVHLDGKIFSNDEATTSIHVSGKTIAQFSQTVFDGRLRTAADLLVFQRPDTLHGPGDVVSSLAVEDPQHPPLYYLIERQWEIEAGSSLTARRALSAVYGVLAIAGAVWLGVELWSLLAGAISGALVAASPFAIAYAQVAREYSLWLALTFAATALLVRAARERNPPWWIAYAICCVAGVYTDTLFVLVVVAHALTLPFIAAARLRAAALGFGIAALAVTLAYAPWIAVLRAGLARGLVTNNAYLAVGLPLKLFALKWIFNVGALFYDADYTFPKTALLILPGLAALAIAFVACARALRTHRVLAVVFALASVVLVALVVPDLLHHEQRSTSSRYLVPLWVAAYAALGVGIATAFDAANARFRATAFAFVAFTAVTGFVSFAISTRHESSWVDGSAAQIGPIARAIERVPHPLVVWQASWGPGAREPEVWDFSVMMLADVVRPTDRFIIFRGDAPVAIPARSSDTLLLEPSDAVLAHLREAGRRTEQLADGSPTSTDAQIASLRNVAEKDRRKRGAASTNLTLWSVSPPLR